METIITIETKQKPIDKKKQKNIKFLVNDLNLLKGIDQRSLAFIFKNVVVLIEQAQTKHQRTFRG